MRGRFQAIVSVALAVVVLGALYWSLKDRLGEHEAAVATSGNFALTIPALQPGEPTGLRVDNPVFKTVQGQTVTLTVHSARPGAIHIHGYEQNLPLVQDGEVTLSFQASTAGLFPIHLHTAEGTMEHVALLEVHPQ